MPISQVNNPFTNKVEQVNFSGDEPTQDEIDSLFQMFEREAKGASSEVNLATASSEEIQDYIREKRKLGVDPATGEKIEVEDELKDPGVDYTSGLQDFRIRAGFANKEKDSEKAAYLESQVGADGFRQDKGKRFIITKKGREALGMPDGPEFAVDEEGFSLKYDTADFIGEAGVPLTVGLVASVLTGGLGTIPAMAIVGGATATGKLLDEAFEAAQGYQRQTAGEIAKDAAWEGVFGATGEGVGRGLSRVFGRIFKGSGSKTAEEAKKIGREMRELGLKPTVEGGAPGVFGIVTRLQAVYEGIAPNKKAAEDNVTAILKELKGLKGFDANEESIEALGKTIQDDVQKLYSKFDEVLETANKDLNTTIEREIARIMEPLKKGDNLSEDMINGLQKAKEIFGKNVDFLYKKVDQQLGRRNQIIPFTRVQETIDEVLRVAPLGTRQQFEKGSAIAEVFEEIRENARKRLLANGVEASDENIKRAMFATPLQANILRATFGELEYTGNRAFGKIKGALDQSFKAAEDLMEIRLAKAENRLDELEGLPGNMTDLFQEDFGGGPVSIKQLKAGLSLLEETRRYYAKGYARLNDADYQALIRTTRAGRVELDPAAILPKVVKKNKPKLLQRILRSRRGVPLAFERLDEAPLTVRFGESDITLDQAEDLITRGVIRDTKSLRSEINAAKAAKRDQLIERGLVSRLPGREGQALTAKEIDDLIERGFLKDPDSFGLEVEFKSGYKGEELRQSLASAFLRETLANSTKDGVVDGVKFATAIDDLGTTKNVLFRTELKDLEELTTVLKAKASQLDSDVIEGLSSRPIAEALKGAKEASEQLDALNKQTYLKSLRDKDASKIVDTIFTRNNANTIKAFMNNSIELRVPGTEGFGRTPTKIFDDVTEDAVTGLTPHQKLVDQVQEAAMGRILRSLGDVDSPMFQDDFLSGRLGGKLKTTLEGYGKESLNAMFGEAQADRLMKLSEIMIRASDKPLAGKGGLAAPSIALGLSIFGLMTAPLQTIGALAFYTGMSKALRSGFVLDIMLASRKPGADKLGQALQTMQTINAQIETQAITSEEGPFKLSPEAQRSVRQITAPITSSLPNVNIPNVTAPVAGTATRIDPTNPIINPDPATQALAQRLAGTSAITR